MQLLKNTVGLGVLLFIIMSAVGYTLHFFGIPNTGAWQSGAFIIASVVSYFLARTFISESTRFGMLKYSASWATTLFVFDLLVVSRSAAWEGFWSWEPFVVYALVVLVPLITVRSSKV